MDRRSFLKATGVGIGVALAPNLLTSQSVQAA
jgi:TAT (twin-arginine translocation) pathway signal sequence